MTKNRRSKVKMQTICSVEHLYGKSPFMRIYVNTTKIILEHQAYKALYLQVRDF